MKTYVRVVAIQGVMQVADDRDHGAVRQRALALERAI